MAQALATLTNVQDRLDWTLTTEEERLAQGALDDASEMARGYGSQAWVSVETAPPLVRTYVLRAVTRFLRNPDGYVQSRAGDETLVWAEKGDDAGSVAFTDAEIKAIQELAGKKPGIYSVQVSAFGPQRTTYAPAGTIPAGFGKPFPMFCNDTDNW